MDRCASCGHKVPVHNMMLHELNCRGAGTKPSKKRSRAESGGAGGSTAKPINTQRSSAVAKKDKEGAKTSAGGQGKGKQSKKEEAMSPDEKKEARRRKAEERRKAEINDLRSKIMESRCEGKHASRYEETRREYGFGSKVGATPDPITVPQVIKIGLAGFDCVRHPSGQDQHDLQTRLWKAEKYLAAFPRLLEWQCPEPGEEDEDEEWELMRQVLKRARARHETGHKRARIEGKRRAARSDDSGSDDDDDDDEEDEGGDGAAEELQLVLVVPQKFTPRGFAFDVEKEGDFDAFLSKVDGLGYERILLLFQLPFSFVFRADRRNVMRDQRISRVRAWELKVCAHGKYRVAFEFRHYSWDHDDFRTSVLRCGITMVSHDAFDYEMLRREAGHKANRKGAPKDEQDEEEDRGEDEDTEEEDEAVPPQPTRSTIVMPMPYRFYPNKMTSRALVYFRLHGVEGTGDYGPKYIEQLARKILKSHEKFPEREVFVVFANTHSIGPAQPGEVDRGKATSAVVDAQHLGVALKKLCMEQEGGEESGEGEEDTREGEGEGEDEEGDGEEEEEEDEEEGKEDQSEASGGVERASADRRRTMRFMEDSDSSADDRYGFLSPSRGAKSIKQEEESRSAGGAARGGAGVISLLDDENDSDATMDEGTGSGASGSAAASSSSGADLARDVKEEPLALQPKPAAGGVIDLCDSDSDC